jgi:hypothetical protein
LDWGARVGYSVPFGSGGYNGADALSDAIKAALPLWFDLGYRVSPHVMVGGYAVYAFGWLGDSIGRACGGPDAECSTHDVRLGAQLQYRFAPSSSVDPWLGVGTGYEWLKFSLTAFSMNDPNSPRTVDFKWSTTSSGFQFLNLQGGVDLAPGRESIGAFGPFVDFSIGQFSHLSCSGPLFCNEGDTKTHEWLTIGIRGTLLVSRPPKSN